VSCQPEYVTAYVDGELEPEVRGRIEAHLAGCGACGEQAAAERELRLRLRALPAPEPPAALEFALRRRLRARRGVPLARVLLPLAAGLVVAVLWGRASAPVLTLQLSRDHGHCYGLAKLPAQVLASSIEPVAAWFGERGTTLPPLPSSAAGLELVGARFCPLIDRKVAHLYYRDAERRLSLFVVPEPVRLDGPYAGVALGRPVHLRRLAGHTLAIVADRESDAAAFERSFDSLIADAGLGASWR
jgi:anti-sigma factor RsiW